MNSIYFEKKKEKILNLYKEKKFDDAIKHGEKLLKKNNDPQLLFLISLSLINLQNFVKAEEYLNNLISIKKTPELYYTYGNVQKKLKKYHDAIISFNFAIELKPSFSEAYNNLGNTQKLLNKREEALKCFKKAVSLRENNIEALFNLSLMYKENNNYEDLIVIYKKILDIDKNNVKTLYNLGTAYLILGDEKKGKEYFVKVFEVDRSHIPSARNYINLTKINQENQIFKYLENINLDNLTYENKVFAFEALSKGYFDQDKIELGFNYLKKFNLLKKEKSNYSIKTEKKLFNDIKIFFNNKNYFDIKFSKNKLTPIFILGMPRSGTTLLEQIISTHSQIYGAGELRYLPNILNKLSIEKPINLTNYFGEIRKYYLDNLSKISQKPFIIDKMPANFRWIGFIVNALPEAKIIHIERNPMAVCWSNYKTNFVHSGMDFNLTQEDIANYYTYYKDLMKFWTKNFEKSFLNVKYENFVENYEFHTKNILTFIGLKWEDQLRSYDKTNRPVTTASLQQVRGKIRKDTSLQWKKYDKYLVTMQKTLLSNKIKF
tara:strand:+ start:540 stop:2177 length:1638 start_codon:yes stop_codon:yes gene_type:complete